jgi:bacteriorhodopsin
MVALPIGVGFQLCFFKAYVWNSIHYYGIPSEKLMYYITSNIPLVTAFTNGLALFKFGLYPQSDEILNFFFIEWAITTPLLIINIARVLNIQMYKYFLLSSATATTMFLGAVSHNSTSTLVKYTTFGIGCGCYVSILLFLASIYFNRKKPNNSLMNDMYLRQYVPTILFVSKWLIILSTSVWACYPVTLFLYENEITSLTTTISLFVALDVLSKGVFTSIILGLNDYLNRRDSFLQTLLRFPTHQSEPVPKTASSSSISVHVIEIRPAII